MSRLVANTPHPVNNHYSSYPDTFEVSYFKLDARQENIGDGSIDVLGQISTQFESRI